MDDKVSLSSINNRPRVHLLDERRPECRLRKTNTERGRVCLEDSPSLAWLSDPSFILVFDRDCHAFTLVPE